MPVGQVIFETDTTFINGMILEIEGDYVKLPVGTYTGFPLNMPNEYVLKLDGALRIANYATWLKIENNITIPSNSSITIDNPNVDDTYVSIEGNLELSKSNLTFTPTSGPTTDDPYTINFGNQSSFTNITQAFTEFTCDDTATTILNNVDFGDTPFNFINHGKVNWYNVKLMSTARMTIDIETSSLISVLEGSEHNSLVLDCNAFHVGTLNISPTGELHIEAHAKPIEFLGELTINNKVYISGTIASESDSTKLIINSSKFNEANPLKGTIKLNGNSSLQINSNGNINLDETSSLQLYGDANIVINGLFRSTVIGATYSYYSSSTINGEIVLATLFATIMGQLQLTSSGRLYIGIDAVEGNDPITSTNAFFGSNSQVYISGTLTILGTFFNNGTLRVNDSYTIKQSASFNNSGTVIVKADNANDVNGRINVVAGGSLIYNGSYTDSNTTSLTINKNGILTVNDALDAQNITSMTIMPRDDTHTWNVLINSPIIANTGIYIIQPQQQSENMSVSITSKDKLAEYKQSP